MDNGNEKKLTVKLICVLLSFGLWLYVTNVENPTRKSEIRGIEVEMVNTEVLADSKLALSPNQKFYVDLTIEGPANEIYTAKKEDFKLRADISAYALKKGDNNIPVEIVNYPQGINIKNNGVIAIKVKIEDLVEKEVKVDSRIKTNYKEGFSQGAITINPEKVTVYGPATAVDKVVFAALVGEVKDIDKDMEEEFDIQAMDKEEKEVEGVGISETKGTLSLKVAKGKEVPIKTTYTGVLKNGLSIETVELSRNRVNILGDSNKVKDIEQIELEPINLSDITGSREFTLKLIPPQGITIAKGEDVVTVKIKIKDTRTVTKDFENIRINYLDKDENKYKYEVPEFATVTVEGTEEDLKAITAENLKVEVSVKGLIEGEHNLELKAMLLNVNNNNIKVKSNSGPITIKITTIK
ncbi:CdaR family protein [Clostridium paraputrificum]|uniref:CdaR family protein n=1 Tax=Clostridium paraputrificum TaxID=29363 RepID=UPI003D325A44